MKFIYYPLVLLRLPIFGQVVLWFGQAKYTLYLSEGTSELERKFLALICPPEDKLVASGERALLQHSLECSLIFYSQCFKFCML